MIKPDGSPIVTTTLVAPVAPELIELVQQGVAILFPFELFVDWEQAIEHDEELRVVQQSVKDGQRRLPPRLLLKLSIAECSIVDSRLMFRNRLWIPKRLRTGLIQATHNSLIHIHPGREGLYAILARQYFWPRIGDNIR